MASTPNTAATLLAQLRAIHELTNTEIQIAETRIAQARTEAVRRELTENADNARARAAAIEAAIRDLGGLPDVVGPLVGRAAAVVKAVTEQAQPFDEALLGDLALEHQLLDRARYLKALAAATKRTEIEELAFRLITAHSATVDWLTIVLAEDALGGPAALRRTPMQAAAGTAVRWINTPVIWSTVAEAIHSARTTAGVLEPGELPIGDYDDLTVPQAVAAVKDLTDPADIRAVVAYEETHKNRHGVVSAAQTRLAAIAQEVAGID